MTGVQTCALPICFPVTIRYLRWKQDRDITITSMRVPHTDFCIAGEKSNPKQIEFLCNALNPKWYGYFAYGGAIRGGKSYVVLFILHQLCLKFPKSKWVIVRASLPDLKKTTIPSFKYLIATAKVYYPYIFFVIMRSYSSTYHLIV